MKKVILSQLILALISVLSYSQWSTNASNNLFSNSKVGIGTENPIIKLDILDSTYTERTFLKLENKSLNPKSSVNMRLLAGQNGSFTSLSHLSESYAIGVDQADFGQLWTSGAGLMLRASGGIVRLETSEEGTPIERMRIDTKGNIGINTAEPQEKLEVNGNILIKDNNALILTSPNGTAYKITVDDNGNIVTNEVINNIPFVAEANVDIFPNPTSKLLNVSIDDQKNMNVDAEIYDVSGKLIFMKNYTTNIFSIDVMDFKTGNYVLKLKDEYLIKSFNFVKN